MFVITMDQEGSTGGADRVPELLVALGQAVPEPVLAFERTAGDEVQGLLAAAADALAAVRTAMRLGGWQVGVGVGDVVDPLPTSTRAATGDAFVRARDAVERAKSRRMPVPVAVTGPSPGNEDSFGRLVATDAEALLQLLGTLVERRSGAGWDAVDVVLGLDDDVLGRPEGAGLAARRGDVESRTRSQAAAMLGVSEQALSKRLRAAAWQQERAALPALARVLEEVDR